MTEKKLHDINSPAPDNSSASITPKKIKTLGGKSKKILLCAGIFFLIVAVAGLAYRAYVSDQGYKNGLARLHERFESINSEYQIDGFVEALDRFVKLYPNGTAKEELESVREYVTRVKDGIPMTLTLESVFTSRVFDIASENDVYVVIAGPSIDESMTQVIEDNNNPTFNFQIYFIWKVNSRPFIFDVNDAEVTKNYNRIGTVVVPCDGITGWRNLENDKNFSNEGFFASVRTHIYGIGMPVCPW